MSWDRGFGGMGIVVFVTEVYVSFVIRECQSPHKLLSTQDKAVAQLKSNADAFQEQRRNGGALVVLAKSLHRNNREFLMTAICITSSLS